MAGWLAVDQLPLSDRNLSSMPDGDQRSLWLVDGVVVVLKLNVFESRESLVEIGKANRASGMYKWIPGWWK